MWQPRSVYAAQILIVLLFALVLVAGSIALSAGAMVLLGPDVKVETEANETRINLPADVLFAFDKAEILPGAEPDLVRAATILKARRVKLAMIEGYTDSKGDPTYNQRLSERRNGRTPTAYDEDRDWEPNSKPTRDNRGPREAAGIEDRFG